MVVDADVAVQLRHGEGDCLYLELGFFDFRIKGVNLGLQCLVLTLRGIEELLLYGDLAFKLVELVLEVLLAARYGR